MRSVAIMRPPDPSYASYDGQDGSIRIRYKKALRQHQRLRGIYAKHGYKVELLPPSRRWCASTFMQDTAFIANGQAMLMNCMSWWRVREPRHRGQLETVLSKYVNVVGQLGLPAELDCGEVVKTDTEYLVGIQRKTARLAVERIREKMDLDRPIRTQQVGDCGLIHMGSSMSYIGNDWLVMSEKLAHLPLRRRYKVFVVPEGEEDAANIVRLSDGWLIAPSHCPRTLDWLQRKGFNVEEVDISEYHKGEGHISCLSINIDQL